MSARKEPEKKKDENEASKNKKDSENSEKTEKQKPTKREYKYNYRRQYVPPGRTEEDQNNRERGFVLDCIALSQISNDYSKANPKLGPAIPPYNSQKDPSVRRYFQYHDIEKVLLGSHQRIEGNVEYLGESIAGKSVDNFHEKGLGFRYLSLRNKNGMGHSTDSYTGHSAFMSDVKDVPGFNGQFGFRRNTPWLRQYPSVFGMTMPGSSHF
ncbi:sperm microtubule associated protein 1-like [Symsagittifera roscoffensis]|uniref:sperm microtubule associated protein 1-like n=1 Tax=Symsagittifera roscoffensis TaxID=84072 RepID=UPI00307B147B